MVIPDNIGNYLRQFASELSDRILQTYPALHNPGDPISGRFESLLRVPFAAQRLAVMGVVKRWRGAKAAALVAECGTGKTLMALSAIHVASEGRPYTALVMAPPNVTEKWCREILITVPGARVFLVDSLRTSSSSGPHGVNEVKYRNGRIVREGFHTTLTQMRLAMHCKTAKDRWQKICPEPSFFVVGRDRAKLSYFWKHSYSVAKSGPFLGSVVNPDTGKPVVVDDERVLAKEFEKVRRSEWIGACGSETPLPNERQNMYSALWQADASRIRRFAPLEFIGRYMPGFFDYGVADEVHELKGDTAQGNALGTMTQAVNKIVVLTGTLLGGYADDVLSR